MLTEINLNRIDDEIPTYYPYNNPDIINLTKDPEIINIELSRIQIEIIRFIKSDEFNKKFIKEYKPIYDNCLEPEKKLEILLSKVQKYLIVELSNLDYLSMPWELYQTDEDFDVYVSQLVDHFIS